MEYCVRIGGRGLKNLTYPCMGVEGVKNCQNHPYVIRQYKTCLIALKNTNKVVLSKKTQSRENSDVCG